MEALLKCTKNSLSVKLGLDLAMLRNRHQYSTFHKCSIANLIGLALQEYEDTVGLTVGDGDERNGKPVSVELSLRLLSNLFHVIQQPLKQVAITLGMYAAGVRGYSGPDCGRRC